MAIAIQSVATGTWSGTTSVTITKPTGLSVGDLLFAVISIAHNSGGSFATPSGWTNELTYVDFQSRQKLAIFSKVADSSDVAASDFTFSGNSVDDIAGVLYRIDDFGASVAIIDEEDGDGGTGTAISVTVDIDTPPIQSILFFVLASQDADTANVSGYTVNGITNPTWTERFDTEVSGASFAVADATITDSNNITTISATGDNVNTRWSPVGLIVLTKQQDAPGTTALLAGTPTIQVPVGRGDTNGTVALLSGTPTIQIPTSTVPDKTIANTDKNDATNIVNTNKNNA